MVILLSGILKHNQLCVTLFARVLFFALPAFFPRIKAWLRTPCRVATLPARNARTLP